MSEQANPTALAAERLQDMNNQEIGGLRLDEWCDYWQRTEAELGEDAFKFETESEKHMLSDLRAASKVLKSYLALTSPAEQDEAKPTERPDIAEVIAKELMRHYTYLPQNEKVFTDMADIIRKHVGPLVEAAKLCRQELSFMLNHYPERRGGAYERALDAVRAALVAAEEGK